MSGRVIVLRGDAAHLPLPDGSVDLIVTSPPYFGLRSYTDSGKHYDGQIGSEATPREFIDALLACTREWMRVLKPEGSLFVNLGDKYSQRVATRPSSHQDGLFPNRPELRKDWKRDRAAGLARMPYENVIDGDGNYVREKSLMLLPQRYALGCIDDLGLILRAEIVWSKPNGLPESVTDRVRRSHEQVFHFTKSPRYFAAVDEIREPHQDARTSPRRITGKFGGGNTAAHPTDPSGMAARLRRQPGDVEPRTESFLGKLPGSVWEIPLQPLIVPAHLGVDHFAAFPVALVKPIILGWSPSGICTECGEGRRPVANRTPMQWRESPTMAGRRGDRSFRPASGTMLAAAETRIVGYACACPDASAPTRPALVVDPFAGTGTTMLTASVLGRIGIGVDRSADYCRLARWRTADPAERARALGVPKPPPIPDGQGDLFDLEAS